MELLASTCKILYDKDYLDSKEKLKKCLFIENILFDNYYGYKIKKDNFFKSIINFVNESFNKSSIKSLQNYMDDLSTNPIMTKFNKFLLYRINVFINNSNNEWAEFVCYSFINTLSGSIMKSNGSSNKYSSNMLV